MVQPWTLVMLLVLATCSTSLGAVPGRRLAQATAVASANAVSTGGTSSVTSNANAQSTGTPTTAVSNAQGVAGPGQSVTVNCNAFARDSQQYKTCIGTPSPPALTFENAPTCNATAPNATCVARDSLGRCWNLENGRSCAYKDAAGRPLNETQIGAPPSPSPPPPSPTVGSGIPTATPPAPAAAANASANATALASAAGRRRTLRHVTRR